MLNTRETKTLELMPGMEHSRGKSSLDYFGHSLILLSIRKGQWLTVGTAQKNLLLQLSRSNIVASKIPIPQIRARKAIKFLYNERGLLNCIFRFHSPTHHQHICLDYPIVLLLP